MTFKHRRHAGQKLAQALGRYHLKDASILALPRGGVPVAYQIARSLHLPLTVLVSRKIGAPGNPEYGIGAVSEFDTVVLDRPAIRALGISDSQIKAIKISETKELDRRIDTYRQSKKLPDLTGKTAVLVDDGLATGVTAKSAIQAVKQLHPQKVILAVPVCAAQTAAELKNWVDDLVCLHAPTNLRAIGLYYRDFAPTTDQEVVRLLHRLPPQT